MSMRASTHNHWNIYAIDAGSDKARCASEASWIPLRQTSTVETNAEKSLCLHAS